MESVVGFNIGCQNEHPVAGDRRIRNRLLVRRGYVGLIACGGGLSGQSPKPASHNIGVETSWERCVLVVDEVVHLVRQIVGVVHVHAISDYD